MVDLAKIRRKAKEKKDASADAAADSAKQAAASPAVKRAAQDEPVAPDVAAPVPQKEKESEAKETSPAATSAAATPAVAPARMSHSAATAAAIERLEDFKRTANVAVAGSSMTATDAEVSEEEHLELLTFILGREQYAVPIERIVEIIPPRPATRVPNADGHVVGVISLRGTIVTVIDVRARLGHNGTSQENDRRMIVIDNGGETAGFVVDRVLRVIKTVRSRIEPPPMVHSSEQSDFVRGVFHQGGVLSILLDLDTLMRSQ